MTERKRFQASAYSIDDAVTQLPALAKWDGTLGDVDLFIVPRGFEPRACAFPSDLAERGTQIRGTILIGRYRTNTLDNDRRAVELTPLLDAISTRQHIECDADTPSDIQRAIGSVIEHFPAGHPCHVVVDVSAASSTFILSSLLALMAIDRPIRLTILYATAAVYHQPKQEDVGRPTMQWSENDQREQGVSDVGTNELQTGIHHDHLPGFAIAIPSMFASRLQRCLGHLSLAPHDIDEQEVFWILPDTDSNDHKWRFDAVMRTVLDILYSGADDAPDTLPSGSFANCGALNYSDCARLVLREIEHHSGTNMSVIHMGTKLQAIGVAFALAARPEVALVHARPSGFSAATYSDGVGEKYQLQFEELRQHVRRLTAIGTLKIAAC